MTDLKRLIMLCGGYAALWATFLLVVNTEFSMLPGIATAAIAALVSAICLYPAAAIGWFYRIQTGQRRWLAASALAVTWAAGLTIWAVYQFGDRGLQGYDGLAVVIWGLIGGVPLGVLTTGLACSFKEQHKITRRLGLGTLTAAFISLGAFAIEALAGNPPDKAGIIFLGAIATAILALLASTVFGYQHNSGQ